MQTAEQVVAALTGGVVSTAVNIPAVCAEDMEVLGPFVPLAQRLGKIAAALANRADRIEIEHLGRIAERDTRLLTLAVLTGIFPGRTEEEVNLVNAPDARRGARDRGLRDARDPGPRLQRPRPGHAPRRRVKVVGTTLGHRHRPHLLEAWGQRFNLQIDDPLPDAVPLLRRPRHGRPRRHLPGRARHQHQRRRGRPPGDGPTASR